jgi:N-acetyl-1-D-myo-inositol-2-amino-2-deoxy-alpha-D-glucopyranoside deacetylase
MTDPERVLFVHAHPDDESIDTGGTLATLVDRGAVVTLLTCTRGERGEVIADDLQYALQSQDTLASVRELELRRAAGVLGVTDHRFLGDANARWGGRAPRRYIDSGMRWGKSGAEATSEYDPASLTAADFGDVAADIAAVILNVQPHAVVSYDATGGYGHPDHIRAQQAAQRAAEVYGVPFYAIEAKDVMSTITVDVAAAFDRKRRALEAYRSQVVVDGDSFALADGATKPIARVERFQRVAFADDRPVSFHEQHWFGKVIVSLLAAAIGVAAGALLSVYNQTAGVVFGKPIWLGAIVAVLLVAALLFGLRLAFGTRVVAFWCAIGMIVIVGLFTFPSAGGSVLIPTIASDGSWNGPGILWAITPVLVAVVVLGWPKSNRRSAGRIAVQTVVKGP